MELKVNEVKLPQKLEFNYEDLKAELTERVREYQTAIYTEDMIKQAKADRAKLNSFKKTLNDARIRLEREYMEPFNDFKSKIAELMGIVDAGSNAIDIQINDFDDKRKSEKQENIIKMFNACMSDLEWLRPDMVWNQKWLNASYSMKQIETDLYNTKTVIIDELEVLGRLKDFSFEAQEVYKQSLNLNESMRYADGLVQMAEAKAKAEAQKAAEQPKPQENEQMEMPVKEFMPRPEEPSEVKPELYELSFKVRGTADQLQKLSHFMKASGIYFERV